MGLEWFRPALVPIFAVLSIAKFVMVVGWYKHLKFDDPFFLRMFTFALVIALTIATAFVALFHGIYFG
jgi:cytochrome c oxidase subunit 4